MDADGRAWLSLQGLAVGDAFGGRYFGPPEDALARIARRELPASPWPYSDDTEMALSIVEVLRGRRTIDQDLLATTFAVRMQAGRGYGMGTYELLEGLKAGGDWRALAPSGFGGLGSFGNGAAMRVAPLGAFFADEPVSVVADHARLSAEVTHAHPEGIAGAIAVAVAAALAWRRRGDAGPLGRRWIEEIRDAVPAGYTRDAVGEALGVAPDAPVIEAAKALGNGSGITAPDTVPICFWMAARRPSDFAETMWDTVSILGDRDTTCAIVGGILALRTGRDLIPADWLAATETLPLPAPGARAV
jgi:ADP-ribosylglycohydrolase